jgi:hypothetical protein
VIGRVRVEVHRKLAGRPQAVNCLAVSATKIQNAGICWNPSRKPLSEDLPNAHPVVGTAFEPASVDFPQIGTRMGHNRYLQLTREVYMAGVLAFELLDAWMPRPWLLGAGGNSR